MSRPLGPLAPPLALRMLLHIGAGALLYALPRRLPRGLRGLLLAAVLCGLPQASHALCVLACTCWVSTTPLSFSPYNPLSAANDDSVGHAKVGCGGIVGLLIPYTIALGPGGGTLANRKMSNGSKKLPYNLYSSAAYSSIWGDGTGGTVLVNGSILLDVLGLSPDIDHPIYGRVPASQTGVTPGIYTDTITVTVTYQ